MKKVFSIILATAVSISCFAQDQKAKAILDKLSTKTKSYKTIQAEFDYTITNKEQGLNETQSGAIKIKGSKYQLSIKGQEVVVNDKYMFTVLKESKEIQLSDLPDEDDEDFVDPSKIFTIYETGFKNKFVKENQGLQVINLYPNNPEEKTYHRIVLYINSAKSQITKVEVFGKDGTNVKYKIKKLTPNQAISDDSFIYDKTKYAGYEEVDLRG